MVSRRRHRLRRSLPWLLAAGFVVMVGLFVYDAVRTNSDQIVSTAAGIRLGDPANNIAKNPTAALDMVERVLEREPNHYQALLEAARAWAALRNYKNAVEMLERAAELARSNDEVLLEVRAMRQGVAYLIADEDFEKGIDWARMVAELQPHSQLAALNHGLALYNSSLATQASLVKRFVPPGRTTADRGVEIQQVIETYVSDLWGEPDLEALIDNLVSKTDDTLRHEIRAELLVTRERFQRAADVFAEYPNVPGFDQGVAKGYVDLLRRSGRIYDAHIEAAIALRQHTLATGLRRSMLEAQAQCLLVLGENKAAADLYEQILDDFRNADKWPPSHFVHSLIEHRVNSQDWEWILSHHDEYEKLTNNDVLLQYAQARALQATGDLEGAVEQIGQPFSVVSLGTRMPKSLRGFPDRRRGILLLAYELFDAVGDLSSLEALDSLVENFPHDTAGLDARINVQLNRDKLELAMGDAFDLLSEDRRQPSDFQRWLDIANELSVQRYNIGLKERAIALIERDLELQNATADAGFQSSGGRGRGGWDEQGTPIGSVYLPKNPALAWTIVRERIPRNQLERARNDLRQLAQAHPQVQEFRLQLGKLLVRQGLLESAVGEFRYVLDHVPSDTEVIDLTTRIEFALDNPEAAAKLVNQMILQDPLGVGAVRYGQQLLERGRTAEAAELIRRLLSWPGFKPGRDLYIMSARAFLALGDIDRARTLLITLSQQYPNNESVALLGLEFGLALNDHGLMASAIENLRPMISGLLPDQVGKLAWTLLESEYNEELLEVFPQNIRHLPVLRPALRPLAEAAKAVGDIDEADQLLEWLDDAESLRDRFLLLTLSGRADEASRRLRLSTVHEDQENDLTFCKLAASSMTEFQTMYDLVPVSALRAMGLDQELDAAALELLDAVLRIMPNMNRLEDVVPRGVVEDPLGTYPRAGPDVVALLSAVAEDPERTAETLRAITMLMLANERPFWWRESRFLGKQILDHMPRLNVVSRMLAKQFLETGQAEEALEILKYLMTPDHLDPATLEMFIEASLAYGHDEWGLAMAFAGRENDDVRLVLAESLLERRFVEECLPQFIGFLKKHPSDARALAGIIQTYSTLGRPRSTLEQIKEALEAHPHDETLAHVCIESLAALSKLDDEAVHILEQLTAEYPQNLAPYDGLASYYAVNDLTDRLQQLIDVLIRQLRESSFELWSEEAETEASVARRVARTARKSGLSGRARQLNTLVLQLEPGSVGQFRELASLELADGNLEIARSYLEVLSIVRPYDKDGPLTLARLLFEQVGQPHVAADIIRRTYGKQVMPPAAVEVLAAEAYLRGDPERALLIFRKISQHPEVTAETLLTVGRIAFAAGLDTQARGIFSQFLTRASQHHPARSRVNSLIVLCGPAEDDSPPAAQAKAKAEARPARTEDADVEQDAATAAHPAEPMTTAAADDGL